MSKVGLRFKFKIYQSLKVKEGDHANKTIKELENNFSLLNFVRKIVTYKKLYDNAMIIILQMNKF